MTRIIRLTESDLTRIVKRVIKEQVQAQSDAPPPNWKSTVPEVTVTGTQKMEDAKLTPRFFNKINAANGWEVTASVKSTDPTTNVRSNNPIMWKITPSTVKTKDNNGKVVRVPGMLYLRIEPKGIANTFIQVELNCKTGQIKSVGRDIQNTYDKSLSLVAAGIRPFQTTANGFEQIFDKKDWKYVGAIKEVGDTYCKSV